MMWNCYEIADLTKCFLNYGKLSSLDGSKREKNIATVFGRSYADNACYSGFRYNTFGVPGATPNDNPTEPTNQDIKGTRNQKGMIQVRRKFNQTILHEFPKLVYSASFDKCGVDRDFQMLSASNIVYEDARMVLKLKDIDVKDDGQGGFFVNTEDFIGEPLTDDRILHYKKIIDGKISTAYKSRENFVDQVHSICHVTLHKFHKKRSIWMGNCLNSFETTKCCYAIRIAYPNEVAVKLEQYIPQEKQKRKRKQNKNGKEKNQK